MARALKPQSEAELAEMVTEAFAARRALEIRGGGTRPLGNPVIGAQTVGTDAISGIELYEPGALTIVIRAGTPLAEINKTLAAENQRLPFEPAEYGGLFGRSGQSTIGGVVATGASGPRQVQAGCVRDSLIGVRFVTGEGEVVKNGGRVMKNVTGYDLVKLMAGSHGTLGILTETSFKLLPSPETAACVLINGLDDEQAIGALSAALGSPFDVSGAAHTPAGINSHPVTMIRVEGFAKSVSYRAGRLKELLAARLPGADIAVEDDPKNVAAGWRWVRDAEAFNGKTGALWQLTVKPTDAPGIVSDISGKHDIEALYDRGGGLIWLLTSEEDDVAASVRKAADSCGGHAMLFRAGKEMHSGIEAFHPEPRRVAEISAGLRTRFDPAGILNPGRMARMAAPAAA